MRKVYHFLKTEYFTNQADKQVYLQIKDFIDSYNASPTIEALTIALQNDKKISEQDYKEAAELVQELVPVEVNKKWLVEETEIQPASQPAGCKRWVYD